MGGREADLMLGRRPLLLAGISLAVAICAGVGAAVLVTREADDRSRAEPAQPDSQLSYLVVPRGEDAAKLKQASDEAGFEARGVALPPGYLLETVRVVHPPVKGGLVEVTPVYVRRGPDGKPTGNVEVGEFNVRMAHPTNYVEGHDRDVTLDLGLPGVEAWQSGGPGAYSYSIFIGQRSYFVMSRPGPLALPELKALAASLQ